MLKKFTRTVDKMPFAGKFAIAPAMHAYVKARPSREKAGLIGNGLLLSGMVAAHALQAKIGFTVLQDHLEYLETTGDRESGVWLGFDGLYTAAMGAVALRQIVLMDTLRRIHGRKAARTAAGTTLPAREVSQPYFARHKGALAASVAFTLSGQIALGFSYDNATDRADRLACVRTADTALHRAVGDGMHVVSDIRQDYAKICQMSPTDITLPETHRLHVYPSAVELPDS